MDIIYNDISFQDCDWKLHDGKATIEIASTDFTMSQLADIFSENYPIKVYEEDNLIGIWHALEFSSIERKGSGNILITLYVAASPKTTEENLINGINNAEECILELANIYSEMEKTQSNAGEFIQQYRQRVEEIVRSFDDKTDHTDTRFNELISTLNNTQTLINKIQEAVTAAETAIQSMPKNVNERIGALETTYNKLADRIAKLENQFS